jgi:hypothetical protein
LIDILEKAEVVKQCKLTVSYVIQLFTSHNIEYNIIVLFALKCNSLENRVINILSMELL